MRILVATDGSAPATRAVELAARLTQELGGTLKIIHVCSERDVPEEQMSDYTISEHSSSAEVLTALSEEKLRIAREHAAKCGVSKAETATLARAGGRRDRGNDHRCRASRGREHDRHGQARAQPVVGPDRGQRVAEGGQHGDLRGDGRSLMASSAIQLKESASRCFDS